MPYIFSYCGLSHLYRRFKEKKEKVEPEADPERDQRTVFAYQVDGFNVFSVFFVRILNHFKLSGLSDCYFHSLIYLV